jgi:hypothetical protein
MHFQTWQDKAGNAPPLKDGNVVFPNLNAPPLGGEDFQTNLIMPEPTIFLSRHFPPCSILRPIGAEQHCSAPSSISELCAALDPIVSGMGKFVGPSIFSRDRAGRPDLAS